MIFLLDRIIIICNNLHMPSAQRASHLHTLDAHATSLTDERAATVETGRFEARLEIAALDELARSIARSTSQWQGLVRPLDLASPYDAARAGELILETVFDGILDPQAWRVVAAALALAH